MSSSPTAEHQHFGAVESQTLDVFYPFFDLDTLNLISYDELPELPEVDLGPINQDSFCIEGWNNAISAEMV